MTRTKVEVESPPQPARHHPRRRRPRVSCEECRRRRVRCDRQLPCRPCRISRQRLTCRYRDNGMERDGTGYPLPRDGAGDCGRGPNYDNAQPRLNAPSGASALADAGLMRPAVPVLKHEGLASHAESNGSAFAPSPLLLCNSREKTKLFPPGHWIYNTDLFEWSRTPLRDRELGTLRGQGTGDGKSLAGLVGRCWDLHRSIKAAHQRPTRGGGSWPDAVAALPGSFPPPQTCSECVDAYINTFHILCPALDVVGFRAEYERRRGRLDSAPTLFLVKLGLVLVMGSLITRPLRELGPLRQSAIAWMDAAHSLLLRGPQSPLSKLDEMEICCLLMLAHRVSGISSPWPGWSTNSLLVLARRAGLHLDSKQSVAAIVGSLEAERRAALWRAVLELIAGEADGPTAQILADNIEEEFAYCPASREDIGAAAAALLRQSLRSRMRVARLIYSRPTATQYSAVLQLAFDLDRLCRELRLVLQTERPALTALVEMQLRHAMLALLQPFVLPARTDAQYYLARQICLQCAMALAAYAHESQPLASAGAEPSLAGSSLLLLQMQMTARGYLRGAFHPAVVCALAMEIIVQLSDETGAASSGHPPYSLDSMARAQRAPIIKTLVHLASQLREMMKLAFPALKRYLFTSSILAQIRALETGVPVGGAVLSELQDRLEEAHAILQRLCN